MRVQVNGTGRRAGEAMRADKPGDRSTGRKQLVHGRREPQQYVKISKWREKTVVAMATDGHGTGDYAEPECRKICALSM